MRKKFCDVRAKANAVGCPFAFQISGQEGFLCSRFAKGDPKTFPHCTCEIDADSASTTNTRIDDPDVLSCDIRASEIVKQLKQREPKLGLGFLVTPLTGEDEGDCLVRLVSSSGIMFEGKLSELFKNETYACLITVRLFDETGRDYTDTIMAKALQRAYENAPDSKMVFSSLLKDAK
jgi:hypothetical protein